MDTRIKLLNYIVECLKEYKGIETKKNVTPKFNVGELVELRKIAERNSLMPVLCETGKEIWTEIGRREKSLDTRNMYESRIKMALPIFEEFEKENIEYAVLKGSYLADVAYGDMNIRDSNDIDILIRKEDIKRIKEICVVNGFVSGKSDRKRKCIIHYNRTQEVAFSLNTHQIATMVKTGSNHYFDFYDTVLDCNFSLFWGGYNGKETPSNDFLRNRFKYVDSNGLAYFVLNMEYNLLQLCLHAYKEANGFFFIKAKGGLCLRAFLDIFYYVIECEDKLDWDILSKLIKEYELERYVYFVMSVIKELFGERKSVNYLITASENVETIRSVDEMGLTRVISWGGIPIKERFFSEKVNEWLGSNISYEEMERLKLAEDEFY
ncbi:MAG: nucleotidyltransferase family protein [Lachnospiraceae bacterium]|nr:nucleotidyltransferase family protein [Lachnospiraceae bacterium]